MQIGVLMAELHCDEESDDSAEAVGVVIRPWHYLMACERPPSKRRPFGQYSPDDYED